uniref:Transmembrane protein 267 n=1 Tax=Timema shepardi TaxID=629360 RepID=A0A7R9FY67_TIMSH|nr:unnamed protein product [Timema shepardi]
MSRGFVTVQDAVGLNSRPFLHCTSVPLTICVVVIVLSHVLGWSTLVRITWLVLAALLSHHIRDGTRRGLWMWPFGSTPIIPYSLYVGAMMALPHIIGLVLPSTQRGIEYHILPTVDSPPFFHRYSSVVLFVCILCMTLSWGLRKDPELDRMSSIVWRVSSHIFGALATHLIRDARLGGLCLWPDSTELSLPYLVYIASIAGIPYALRSKHHSRRPPGQRYDLLQTA